MRSGLRLDVLVKVSESTMIDLGYAYLKHDSGEVVELEVQTPKRFTVRIEKLEDRVFRNPMLGGLLSYSRPDQTNVTIILGEDGIDSKRHVALFVSHLLAALPKDPWKGLGIVESITARSQWKEWMASSDREQATE
ncbi:MAG: hypothetical protein ABR867_03670 [Nitrososphaerales archaeon]|jgi:hypothetical protein